MADKRAVKRSYPFDDDAEIDIEGLDQSDDVLLQGGDASLLKNDANDEVTSEDDQDNQSETHSKQPKPHSLWNCTEVSDDDDEDEAYEIPGCTVTKIFPMGEMHNVKVRNEEGKELLFFIAKIMANQLTVGQIYKFGLTNFTYRGRSGRSIIAFEQLDNVPTKLTEFTEILDHKNLKSWSGNLRVYHRGVKYVHPSSTSVSVFFEIMVRRGNGKPVNRQIMTTINESMYEILPLISEGYLILPYCHISQSIFQGVTYTNLNLATYNPVMACESKETVEPPKKPAETLSKNAVVQGHVVSKLTARKNDSQGWTCDWIAGKKSYSGRMFVNKRSRPYNKNLTSDDGLEALFEMYLQAAHEHADNIISVFYTERSDDSGNVQMNVMGINYTKPDGTFGM
jgi:hypothetical protein